MGKILSRLATVLVVIALFGAILALKPLKPGIDLAGGTTLVYDVTVPDGSDAEEVIDSTIQVLRDRVDPSGTKNLVWRKVAGNRLEVQMPAANPVVTELRDAVLAAAEALREGNLSSAEVDDALALPNPDDRTARIASLAADLPQRLPQLETLATLYDQRERAAEAFRTAESAFDATAEDDAAATRTVILAMEDAFQGLFDARIAYRDAQAELLATNIPDRSLDRLISASNDPLPKPAGAPDDAPDLPSPRATLLDQLKAQYPPRAGALDQLATALAAYEEVKGPLDDPNDLKVLLRGSGVLEMRIAADPAAGTYTDYFTRLDQTGPNSGIDQPFRWFAIDDLTNFVNNEAVRAELEEIARQMRNTGLDLDSSRSLADRASQIFSSMGGGDSKSFIGRAYTDGQFYILLGNQLSTAMAGNEAWRLTSANRGTDQRGFPALNFTLDALGASRLGQITEPHVGWNMAVLLDGRIITAPRLNGKLSNQGQITGQFSNAELDYMIRSMKAGSLEGQLSPDPISEKTVGATLGQDNIDKGIRASIISLILVCLFMLVYYLFAGGVANAALCMNMVIILGVMAAIESTFTLPGIAGLVLTIGMAVDANVLIFERIREELDAGSDLPLAIKLGFGKAFSTIVDANLTTLITCLVLGYTATAEVKGFAVVLGIGILATLFTALFASRIFFDLYLKLFNPKSMHMAPTIFPGLKKILRPNINWVELRHIFIPLSAVLLVAGIATAVYRGEDMLDIEFRSGTAVVFELKEGESLPIADVRERLTGVANAAVKIQTDQPLTPEEAVYADAVRPVVQEALDRFTLQTQAAQEAYDAGVTNDRPDTTPPDFSLLAEAAKGSVVTVGQDIDGRYQTFSVSTLLTDSDAVSGLIKAAFLDELETTRPIAFAGRNNTAVADAINNVVPITARSLTEGFPEPIDTKDHVGGVAVLLPELEPPASVTQIEQKIERQINQPPHDRLPARDRDVVPVGNPVGTDENGEATYAQVVLLVKEEGTNYAANPTGVNAIGGLGDTEWAMVRDAMAAESSLKSVTQFDAQVSGTMQQQAITAMALSLLAVVAYIWFRFGSIRYGLAAIAALIHDVSIAIGLVAISGWIAELDFSRAILLDAFKVDLAMVAAFLTIVGYSLNDTIIVFDRIRENRGKLARATPAILNDSINQTISRTIITSGTTFIAVLVLYLFGGPGVHGFAFTMLIGILIGTYSSVAIASPILLIGSKFGAGLIDKGTPTEPTPTPA
ncbi:MAG: protein translocase subunit SecD [Planctomycetota bacterium]